MFKTLKKKLGNRKGDWVDDLPKVPCMYQTTKRTDRTKNSTRQLLESFCSVKGVQVRVSNPQRIVFVKINFIMPKLTLS
jgi:hypothetical protein